MAPPDPDAIAGLARATVEEHGLAGLSVGVLAGDDEVTVACGWANAEAGIEARPDGIHQLGSITKIYTATMVSSLVADGRLHLDDAVTEHLPELEMAGVDLGSITVRHLLTHTSGLPGDTFVDTGVGDGALERWVTALAGFAPEAEPGRRWSYCNTGFGLLGRVIEKRTGLAFHRALRELVTRPLGVRTPVATAQDCLRFRCAVGHVDGRLDADEPRLRGSRWAVLPESGAAYGATPSARAGDVLAFVRLHLADTSLAAMRDHVADQPRYMGAGQGLGWMRESVDPVVVAHAGATHTQHALLLVCPGRRVASIVFGNHLRARDPIRRLTRTIWGEVADLDVLADPEPVAGVDVDWSMLAGTFTRHGSRTTLVAGDRPRLDVVPPLLEEVATYRDLEPVSRDGREWRCADPLGGRVGFDLSDWVDGAPQVLHHAGRANVRTGQG